MRSITQLFPTHAAEPTVKQKCLESGEMLVEIGVLGQKSHLLSAGYFGAVASKNVSVARVRSQQTQDNFHGGGFTGTIRADEAINLSGIDRE